MENPGIVNVTYDDSDDVKLKGMPWVCTCIIGQMLTRLPSRPAVS